jgi:hypothetical protein
VRGEKQSASGPELGEALLPNFFSKKAFVFDSLDEQGRLESLRTSYPEP